MGLDESELKKKLGNLKTHETTMDFIIENEPASTKRYRSILDGQTK